MIKCSNCPRNDGTCIGEQQECTVSKEELTEQIVETLKSLYSNEKELIEVAVNEICISAYFWHYFKDKYQQIYHNMNIDLEYDRNNKNPKYYLSDDLQLKKAKPDMLIHKRKCNKHNFAYFELKKNTREISHDYEKLRAFTSDNLVDGREMWRYVYKYRYGLSILLDLENDKVVIKWFEKGDYAGSDIYSCLSWKRL